MADKQIIIDGCDVSGCDFLAKEDDYSSYSGVTYAYKGQCMCSDEEMCKEHPKCFYKKVLKQLKAKEQECEELKKIIDEAKNSKLDLKSFLVGEAVQKEYEQQLDQLKAENTLLQMQIEERHKDMFNKPPTERSYCKGCILPYTDENYKQAIEKIKEIIHFNKTNRLSGGACISIEQILQICDEVNDVK